MAFPQLIFMAIVALVIPKLEDFFNFKKLDIWTGEIPKWFARVFYGGIQRFALFWHNYEIHGIDNIRRDNCLLVGYHSRCTVDAVYATAFLEPTTIMSPIFFAVPGSKALFESINCVSSHGESKNSADSFIATVVRGGRPVMLFPGGHHEVRC